MNGRLVAQPAKLSVTAAASTEGVRASSDSFCGPTRSSAVGQQVLSQANGQTAVRNRAWRKS
ncbi:hypothetical protein ZHAS_00012883 [Anopheles sinensis]|uniref:Uncharacterized protein n=1 Tax=Anopheles sinensis TaxID=74873 RepID=A0A084W4B3_ANOSI|nr:hypothetical protein ZHAS_00012883 [Anopheles sinensis]